MKKLNLRALRVLKNSKIQYIAVTMVIIIGLMSYIALSMALNNLDETVNEYYEITNFADGYIDFAKISEFNIDKISEIDGIEAINGRIVDEIQLHVVDENVRAKLISVPQNNGINQLYFKSGSNRLDSDGEIFVLSQFAKARGYSIGEEIDIVVYGKQYTMTIKNIVDSPEFVYLIESEQTLLPDAKKYGIIYVTESFAQSALDMNGVYNQAIFTINPSADISEIFDQVDESFENLGITRTTEKKNQLSNRMLTEEIEGGRKSAEVIPVLFLFVAATILVFMINRMVKNDRTMIGILKAMGYTNREIMEHYVKLTALIGFIGAIVGIILGFQFSGLMAKIYVDNFFNIPMLKTVFYPVFAINSIIISVVFTTIAGIWGSKKILNIHPAESMRPEAPKIGKRIFLEKFPSIWNRIRFDWKSVIRSLIRNKKRLIFTMVGIAMTYSLTLMPLSMMDLYDDLFISQFEDFQRMDYNINFKTFVDENDLIEIEKITKANNIESKLEIPFEIDEGSKNKIVSLIGIKSKSVMYHFTNIEGKTIDIPDDGVLITESVSNYFGYQIGDKILLQTFLPGQDDEIVIVRDIVQQSLGINFYANIDYVQRKLVGKGMVNAVMVNSDENVKELLEDYHIISSVQSLQDISDMFMEFMDYTIYSMVIMLLFSGILGFAIVYNSGIMMINERKLEFSSMRVMGFKKIEIFQMVTRETLVISVLGILLGIPMGQLMLYSMYNSFSNDLYTLKMIATPIALFKTALTTGAFIAISIFATYENIHRLNFIDALKNRMT